MGNRAVKLLNFDAAGALGPSVTDASRTCRFGVFELDLRAGELRRNGAKVKLQGQPFQVLTLLLEKPGEVVTREDLRNRLWPADTFVDFDHSLNAAIRRLRDALGDSAENPTFVETMARRGYRFLAPVSIAPANGNGRLAAPVAVTEPAPRPATRLHVWWLFGGAAAIVLVLVGLKLGLVLGQGHPADPPRVSRLTANPADDRVRAAAISRDGKYLAFSDETGFYLRQIGTAETHPLTLPAGYAPAAISWFPDSAHLVVALHRSGQLSSLWEVSALGGNARKLSDDGTAPAVSPDGKEIAFITGKSMREEVWLMAADGGQPGKLLGEEGDIFGSIAWSPDSSRIAYTKGRFSYAFGVKGTIEFADIHTRRVSALPSLGNVRGFTGLEGPLTWSSDGHLVYTLLEPPPRQLDSNLWSLALDHDGQPAGTAVRLTSDSGSVSCVTISGDGKRVVYVKGIPQPDVYVARLVGRDAISEPKRLTLDDRQDLPFDWTRDGKAVIFVSDRTGTFSIYKQALDQAVPDLLVSTKDSALSPRLSPDGTQLLYESYPNSTENISVVHHGPEILSSVALMRMPVDGGAPQQVLQATGLGNHQCSRAPANVCLYSVAESGTFTFFRFDPMTGSSTQAYQIKDDAPQFYNWSLSPDGTTLAIAKGKWADAEHRIHLVFLNGSTDRWLTIQDWPALGSLDWAADSKTLWATTIGDADNALLQINLQGRVRPVWRPKKVGVNWAIPSRDGRYLALHVGSGSANVWMLERP